MANQTAETTPLALSPAKAADLLGVSRTVINNLMYSGELPNIKVGRRRLIPIKAVESWMEQKLGEQQKTSSL